ncbi:MAG: diguanylate cyclase [Thiobacillus sp.]
MSDLPSETRRFVAELDAAVEAHMNWTRRILRCAVLRATPGEDVLDPLAHTLCRFGHWFMANRDHFEALDAVAARRVEAVHQTMHDAIRSICNQVLAGQPGQSVDLDAYEQSQSELLGLLAMFKTLVLSQAVRNDQLTGLPLRYGIENEYRLCQNDAQRNHTLLYIVLIDVDHFKRVNDTYGHPVGDRVLQQLVETLKSTLRSGEPLYRYGGEEFLWLLKCKTPEEAKTSARRVLATVGTTPIAIGDDETLRLTITLGLARAGDNEDLSSIIQRADLALYEGKRTGRNRYVVAES